MPKAFEGREATRIRSNYKSNEHKEIHVCLCTCKSKTIVITVSFKATAEVYMLESNSANPKYS